MESAQGRGIVLGDWVLDPGRQRLQRGTEIHALNPKEMGVLQHLVESAPNLVRTEALLERNWPDVVVGDHVVHEVIARLRKALGDNAQQPRYIETLRKRGYRLAVPVETAKPVSTIPSRRHNGWRVAGIVGFVALAAVVAWRYGLDRNSPQPPATAIAVLRFEDLSPAQNLDWLARSMSETLAVHLSRVEQLQVVPVLAVSGTVTDATHLGERFDVGTIVFGSVQQTGTAFTVTAQLVDARTGVQRWSAEYSDLRGSAAEVKGRAARVIVPAIESDLGLRLPVSSASVVDVARYGTQDVRAYQLWREAFELKFADDVTEQDALEALSLGREAIAIDPKYVMGHVGVGATYGMLAAWRQDLRDVKRAGRAFERAVELGPSNPIALGNLANYAAMEWHWARAIELTRRAEPWTDVGGVLRALVMSLVSEGRREDADQVVDELLRLWETAPDRHPSLGMEVAEAHFWVRRDASAALAVLDRSGWQSLAGIHLPPPAGSSSGVPPVGVPYTRRPALAYLFHAVGRDVDAAEAFISGLSKVDQHVARLALPTGGWQGMLRSVLANRYARGLACPQRDRPNVLSSADMHAYLGETERMYECLERRWALHDCYMQSDADRVHECGPGDFHSLMVPPWTVPPYDAYVDEPRFRALLTRAGVAQDSR